MKSAKKFLCLVLAVVMTLSLMSVGVFAADDSASVTRTDLISDLFDKLFSGTTTAADGTGLVDAGNGNENVHGIVEVALDNILNGIASGTFTHGIVKVNTGDLFKDIASHSDYIHGIVTVTGNTTTINFGKLLNDVSSSDVDTSSAAQSTLLSVLQALGVSAAQSKTALAELLSGKLTDEGLAALVTALSGGKVANAAAIAQILAALNNAGYVATTALTSQLQALLAASTAAPHMGRHLLIRPFLSRDLPPLSRDLAGLGHAILVADIARLPFGIRPHQHHMPLPRFFPSVKMDEIRQQVVLPVEEGRHVDHRIDPIRHRRLHAHLAARRLAPVVVALDDGGLHRRRMIRAGDLIFVGEKQPMQIARANRSPVRVAQPPVPRHVPVRHQQLLPRHHQVADPAHAAQHDHEKRQREDGLQQHRPPASLRTPICAPATHDRVSLIKPRLAQTRKPTIEVYFYALIPSSQEQKQTKDALPWRPPLSERA